MLILFCTVKANAHVRKVIGVCLDSPCIGFSALVANVNMGEVKVRRGAELPDEPCTYD
jgi:hypothetical protein